MKRKRIYISIAALTVVLTVYFIPAFGLCASEDRKIGPTGTNISIIQFDAVIELNRYSPDSLRHDYTVMFARYWVARDYYSVSIVWAEPQSTDMFFAVHPPGLSVASNGKEFKLSHESIKKENEAYKKPLDERGVFRSMFGSYPIDNVRFAEQEASATRVYATDLRRVEDANLVRKETFDLSIPLTEGTNARNVAQLKAHTNGERIDSVQLFDAKKQLLKSINYEYENNAGKTYLRRQIVTLPQRPLMVSFKGDGMKVTLDGKEYRHRDLEVMHHAGGRRCIVDYELVALDGKELSLPARVTVRGGKDDQILRSVHMMNFKKVELDATRAEEAARQFARFMDEQRKYRELRSKYWGKSPDEMENPDVETIRQLRTRIENDAVAANRSPGEKLKHLNILMELNLMLGDTPELERHYQSYLSTLSENRLFQLAIIGGYGVIETAMFQGRRNQAEKLLDRWVDTVTPMSDPELVLLFARRQLVKIRFWTTVKLLEKLSAKGDLAAGVRFEAEALRCRALAELCILLQADDLAKKGLAAKVEADWAASIGKNCLNTMLASNRAQAKRLFAELPAPTQSQQTLMAQIDRIDQKSENESESEE